MVDTYQAIYDAVRSRIAGGDIHAAFEYALRAADFAGCAERVEQAVKQVASLYESPAAIYRPALSVDGNQWCALYGADLQCGVAGFGDSPALAMADFDRNWFAKLPERAK